MIKVCFDSSALGKLVDLPLDDAKNTLAMERLIRKIESARERFELIVSPIFEDELSNAPVSIITQTAEILKRFDFTLIDFSLKSKAVSLAGLYLQKSVLPKSSYADLEHIAYAAVAECDFLVSCDNHFTKSKTKELVQKINTERNVFIPKIVSPSELLKEKIW